MSHRLYPRLLAGPLAGARRAAFHATGGLDELRNALSLIVGHTKFSSEDGRRAGVPVRFSVAARTVVLQKLDLPRLISPWDGQDLALVC